MENDSIELLPKKEKRERKTLDKNGRLEMAKGKLQRHITLI